MAPTPMIATKSLKHDIAGKANGSKFAFPRVTTACRSRLVPLVDDPSASINSRGQ